MNLVLVRSDAVTVMVRELAKQQRSIKPLLILAPEVGWVGYIRSPSLYNDSAIYSGTEST